MVKRQPKDALGRYIYPHWFKGSCRKFACLDSHDKIANQRCWQKGSHDHQQCKYLHLELPAAAGHSEQEGNNQPGQNIPPYCAVVKLQHGREEILEMPSSSSPGDTEGPWSSPRNQKKHKSILSERPPPPQLEHGLMHDIGIPCTPSCLNK